MTHEFPGHVEPGRIRDHVEPSRRLDSVARTCPSMAPRLYRTPSPMDEMPVSSRATMPLLRDHLIDE
jgi:hypothetical protein